MDIPIPENVVKELIQQGENSAVEFKTEQVRPETLAKEMVALSNTSGGIVLLGIDDSGAVEGVERDDMEEWCSNIARNNVVPSINPTMNWMVLEGKKIVVVQIQKGADKPYQTLDGKFWVRVGSTNRQATKEELSRLFQEAGLVHFDIAPVQRAGLDSLNEQKLNDYFSSYYQIPFLELSEEEKKVLLMNTDIVQQTETLCPSVGGLLMFGKAPQRYLPYTAITFAVFNGTELTDELLDKKEINGTLPEMIDQLGALIQVFVPIRSQVQGVKRDEQTPISKKVIRESVVNAICHRDYSLHQRKNSVYVFKNRIEIRSAGKLPNTLTLEKIKFGNSATRNPFILKYLDNMRYVDGMGRGIPTIIKEMGNRAVWTEIGEMLQLTLYFEQQP